MPEQKHNGNQVLAEAYTLYHVMKARKTSYNSATIAGLMNEHMPCLASIPLLKRRATSLLYTQPGWGRREFTCALFELIGSHLGMEVPHDPDHVSKAPRPDTLADAVEARMAHLEMEDFEERLHRNARPQPWDDD